MIEDADDVAEAETASSLLEQINLGVTKMEALDSRQDVIIQKEVRAMFPYLTRKTTPALSMTSDELLNIKLQMAADKEAKQKEKEVRKLARQTKAAEKRKIKEFKHAKLQQKKRKPNATEVH